MGVDLDELIPEKARREVELTELSGRVISIDAYNMLYQFLTAIRQPDGTPLMDSRGNITSHLSGLFYRTINLLESGIKPIYVFDGKPPSFKEKEIERRRKIKEEAEAKLSIALQRGEVEEARRYAQMSARLTDSMVEDAKKLLSVMGVPYITAPAEGEAQAAYLARKGVAWAAGSQDYDSLLFGSPRLVRNLGITGKRKLPKKDVYVEVKPEIIDAEMMYRELGIDREKLIVIALFLGTDYNPGGVKGVGPKTALKIVKSYPNAREALKAVPKIEGINYEEIFEYFLNPPVIDVASVEWKDPDVEGIRKLLVEEHDFSEERVMNAIDRLKKAIHSIKAIKKQTGLDAWFKK